MSIRKTASVNVNIEIKLSNGMTIEIRSAMSGGATVTLVCEGDEVGTAYLDADEVRILQEGAGQIHGELA